MSTRAINNLLVTGGAGFIGVNFIRFLLTKVPEFTGRIINLDALTYAGNPASLSDIALQFSGSRYFFEHGDICDSGLVKKLFERYDIDTVVHFAAESHVDRSILSPDSFVKTNVMGTFNLLDASRHFWAGNQNVRFHHVSTDEVYGSLGEIGYFTETTLYNPRSPYSASKAGSDHLVMAYYHTYDLPVTLSNCSNNYGPYQFPEKLIPLMILNILDGKNLPVYGDGKYVRDWLYVEEHCNAVWAIITRGKVGEKYHIGGENEWDNLSLLYKLIELTSQKANLDPDVVKKTITFVKDRPGHDRRYAIDASKIKRELGWKAHISFEQALGDTVDWYMENSAWTKAILSGEYKNWIQQNYNSRPQL